jgi:hypothetical protein
LKPPTPFEPLVAGSAQDAPPPPLNPALDGLPTALVVTEAPPLPPVAEIALPELGVNDVVQHGLHLVEDIGDGSGAAIILGTAEIITQTVVRTANSRHKILS